MYPYDDGKHIYSDALDLKHPESKPVAAEHNLKQTTINMTFDTVDDAAGFTSDVFSGSKEKVFINEPTFMSPRKSDQVFHDRSEKCIIM